MRHPTFALTVMLAVLIVVMLVAFGCQHSKVTGGTARHDTGGFSVDYFPPNGGRVVVKDDRELVATTQPTIDLAGGDVTKYSGTTAREGEIGGFSFNAKNIQKPNVLGLVIILAGLGAVCWFVLKSPLGTALCAAGIVLAFLAPDLLVWIAIGVVGVVVFLFIKKKRQADKTVTQIVQGNQNAVSALPPDAAETVKSEWDKVQDTDVKGFVATAKAKLVGA